MEKTARFGEFTFSLPLSQRNAADEESVEDEAHITEWECLIVKVNSNE